MKLPVEIASKQARVILRQFPPFDVELSQVRRFSETKFLYLDLGEGSSVIHDLHDALNKGDLFDAEEFEFRPHLTLGGPVSPGRLDSAQQQAETTWNAEHCASRFTVDEVVCLWLSPDSAARRMASTVEPKTRSKCGPEQCRDGNRHESNIVSCPLGSMEPFFAR